MINLELYRIFYAVAEAENISKASENLNISQPAVSKQIKNLEISLGGPLFIRTSKGVKLNEVGEKIFIKVKQALSLFNDVEKSFKDFENLNIGTIKVGISTTLVKKYLVRYIKKFHELYPNILIEISTDPTSEMIKLLKIGLIDFIVAKLPDFSDNELEFITLGEMDNIFIVNEKYKELLNKNLNIKDILTYPILLQKSPSSSRRTIDNYCKNNNISLNTVMNIASSNLLIDFVKAGYGIGLVTKNYVEDELKIKELFELNVTPKVGSTKFGIIKLRNNVLSFSAEKFIKTILEEK